MTRVRLFFLCLLLGACVVKAQQVEKYLEMGKLFNFQTWVNA